jgi:hypothetical protein
LWLDSAMPLPSLPWKPYNRFMDEILFRFKRRGTLAVVGQLVDLDLMNSVNSTEWKGREAESCKLVQFNQARPVSRSEQTDFVFTVSYRPHGDTGTAKGHDAWSGLWSDGWKIKHLNITKDGVLLDAEGKPLPDGRPPVIVECSLFKMIDYNLFDFGEQID